MIPKRWHLSVTHAPAHVWNFEVLFEGVGGGLLSLVMSVLGPAHRSGWEVSQCPGAVDGQDFEAIEFTGENLDVGTFPWAHEGGSHRNVSLLFWLFVKLLPLGSSLWPCGQAGIDLFCLVCETVDPLCFSPPGKPQ